MLGRTDNFSGHSGSSQDRITRFDASPSRFGSPRLSAPASRPDVYTRERTRLAPALTKELEALRTDLEYVINEWHQEMDRVEEALGSKGLETLLDHLQKVNPRQQRELRAYADELTGVLATAKVLRQLHRPVKVMQDWDALSAEVLKTLRSKDQRQNVLTPLMQAIDYYAHSAASAGRAAAFSCYLAGVAGAAIPSLVLAGFILVPAGVHTTIMVRDHFRSQELYHKNRAQAFENMGRALRGVENWPDCSVDDAMAMLAFRDALSRLPERSPAAALDAQRSGYAALRDQGFMPVNVLASCIGQILSLVLAPQWASSLLLNLSSAAYFVQGVLDLLQGDAESQKANAVAEYLQDWLNNKSESTQMQQWAKLDELNLAVQVAMQAHNARGLQEIAPEQFGGRWRQAKGGSNFVNGAMALSAGTLPVFDLAPRTLVTAAGVLASGVSLVYMAGTATKILLRGNVKDQARERCRQAQLMLAMLDPSELLTRMAHNDGRPLTLEIAGGDYDEFNGFAMTALACRPWENEFVALEALAEAVDVFAAGDGDGYDQSSIARIMMEVWKMKPLDWVNLLRVVISKRELSERIAFIKMRLASVVKVDFTLDADQMEPELPPQVLVQIFLSKLQGEDYAVLEQWTVQGDDEAGAAIALGEKFRPDLLRYGEDAFLSAMEKVWAKRRVVKIPTRAGLQLHALHILAEYLLSQRKLFRDSLMKKLEGRDRISLKRLSGSEADVKSFVDAVRQLLDAPPDARGQRRGALFHLARMKLTQDLLLAPDRWAKFSCHNELSQVLGLVDLDVGPPIQDEEDVLVSTSSSSSSGQISHSIIVDGTDTESEAQTSPAQADAPQETTVPQAPVQATGQKLLALVKRPFVNRRAARAGAVLKEVVEQLLAERPPSPVAKPDARPEAKLKSFHASPVKGQPTYTPVQPPQTPLATPRRRTRRLDGASPDDD